MPITEETTLLAYMQALKAKQQDMEFTVEDGMITTINGIANAADWSYCWMLYTSDAENANTAWAVDYNGNIYGSAIFGAETLIVKDGCVYIWFYQPMKP
jgi:hypothetical protein